MIILVAAILLVVYIIFYLFVAQQLIQGNYKYLLFYCILFLPVYSVFLNIIYVGFQVPILNQILQYSKEVLIFGGAVMILFGTRDQTNKKLE